MDLIGLTNLRSSTFLSRSLPRFFRKQGAFFFLNVFKAPKGETVKLPVDTCWLQKKRFYELNTISLGKFRIVWPCHLSIFHVIFVHFRAAKKLQRYPVDVFRNVVRTCWMTPKAPKAFACWTMWPLVRPMRQGTHVDSQQWRMEQG